MTTYTFGDNDYLVLGAGWHPLQDGPAGVLCRWMSPRAILRIPETHTGVTGLRLRVTAPGEIQGRRPGLSIYRGPQLLAHAPNLGHEGHWTTIEMPFIGGPLNGEQFLDLVVENRDTDPPTPLSFFPGIVLGNGDTRELGIIACQLEFLS